MKYILVSLFAVLTFILFITSTTIPGCGGVPTQVGFTYIFNNINNPQPVLPQIPGVDEGCTVPKLFIPLDVLIITLGVGVYSVYHWNRKK